MDLYYYSHLTDKDTEVQKINLPKDTQVVEVELEYNSGSLVPESVQCCPFSEDGNRRHIHWNKAKVRKN